MRSSWTLLVKRPRQRIFQNFFNLYSIACSIVQHFQNLTEGGLRRNPLATFYITSSYILCHIIIHPMSHHHTSYVTSSYILCHIIHRALSSIAQISPNMTRILQNTLNTSRICPSPNMTRIPQNTLNTSRICPNMSRISPVYVPTEDESLARMTSTAEGRAQVSVH